MVIILLLLPNTILIILLLLPNTIVIILLLLPNIEVVTQLLLAVISLIRIIRNGGNYNVELDEIIPVESNNIYLVKLILQLDSL